MADPRGFREAYPLTAKEAVHTPMVFRAGLDLLDGLPWPSLDGIRDFARFARIGDGAVRTALSRAKSEGSLIVERDEAGINRYRLSPSRLAIGNALIHAELRPEGFLIAVFSFKSEDTIERAAIRETLKTFGFKKLAQNTYINGRIETASLKAAVRKLGLEKHLYLFSCPDIDDPDLVGRILAVFDVHARSRYLSAYLSRLTAFLPASLPDDELAKRLLYVGPVHYTRCELGEPPFPAKYLPKGYPLREIQRFYGERLEAGRDILLSYYLLANRKE